MTSQAAAKMDGQRREAGGDVLTVTIESQDEEGEQTDEVAGERRARRTANRPSWVASASSSQAADDAFAMGTTADDVVRELQEAADPSRLPGMARVGIDTTHALGVSVPNIRRIAKQAGHDRALAEDLWATGIHEARMVAALVADPNALTASPR